MVSGGSPASTSVTFAATTVTVQSSPAGRFADGVNVKLEAGETDRLKGRAPEPVGHSIVNELSVALTGSLKLTVMVAAGTAAVAPLMGVVLGTLGAASVGKVKA